MESPESESEFEAIEEALSSLKASAKVVEDTLVTTINRLKRIQQKVRLEVEELSETELRSKPALRLWLQERSLENDCSFQEFFQAFLEEHKEEHRLDLTDRSLLLNKDACKLFGLQGSNVKMSMPELLQRLPLIYH
jgi:hypothetical protein